MLCAPSLGGESFGMVLTEAFAAGTPVVASDIAGYRQVVTHGRDGLLTTPGDPLELAEALRSLWLDPARRAQMSVAARERVQGLRMAAGRAPGGRCLPPRDRGARARRRDADGAREGGARAGRPHSQPARPAAAVDRARAAEGAARVARPRRRCAAPALALSAIVGVLLAFLALRRIGFENVATTLLHSSPAWVLIALALFSTSMFLRAVSWFHIVRAALPDRPGETAHDPERHLHRRADVRHAAGASR